MLDSTQAKNSLDGTGIYLAFPTSSMLKSIYPKKQHKTMVNDQHTKIGIAKDSLRARKRSYLKTFDNEVEFVPIALVENVFLESIEDRIISELRSRFSKVGKIQRVVSYIGSAESNRNRF